MDKTAQNKIQIGPSVTFLALSALFCYLILFIPIPRLPGLTFRNTLYVLPVIFLTAACCGLCRNRYVRAVLFSLLFAMVLLPYSGLINSGISDQYALGGVIPWSDAFTMQLNTQRFLYGGMMGQAAAIRPLSTVFYAVFLRLFGNNYFALQVTLCILTALCMLTAFNEVNKAFGSVCGGMFFTVLYFYIRQRLGTFMTEPYGFICGLLSFQLLLSGIRKNQQVLILAGFLFLSIGLNARPAAMFLFPAFGLWYFFIFMKGRPNRILWSAAALLMMLSGFVLNRHAQQVVYGNDKIPNRQAAEMVYGLCLGGKSWGDVVSTPEMKALNESDNVIGDVAALCIPVLKEHPENLLISLRTIFIDSLIKSPYYGAFSFINGNPQRLAAAVRYAFMVLWVLGLIIAVRYRKNPLYSLLLAGIIGITLSECAAVPFSTNYLRLYAVSMFIPACTAGLFLQTVFNKYFSVKSSDVIAEDHIQKAFVMGTGCIILITAAFGADFIRAHPLEKPAVQDNLCSPGEDVLLTSVDSGSFIYLDEKSNLSAEHIPYFRLPYVRQHIHDTASIEMFDFTDAIDQPTAIIRGIDLSNGSDALIFSPLQLVEGKSGPAQFCGKFIDPPILRNDRFFIPESVIFINEDEL